METQELFGWQEITTDCQCQTENDETGEFSPSNECFGDCYEGQKEDVFYLLDEWIQHNNFTNNTLIRIDGSGMGWRSVSGYKDVSVADVAEALFLNGDFRIRYELSQNFVLTAQRWSHDEPMGSAIFTFFKSPLTMCDACGEIDETRGYEGCEYCLVCLEMRIAE